MENVNSQTDWKRKFRTMAAIAAIVVGGVVFASTFIRAAIYFPPNEIPNAIARSTEDLTGTAKPERILIPAIGVDARVKEVGLTWAGNMSVPPNFVDVGWYKYGTLPGQIGSAVMDGHVDNGFALAGVFKRLKELKPGDDIYVEQNGERLHFVVEDKQLYNYKSAPTKLIFNRRDAARLNLITCDGEWVPDENTSDQRLVVYAVYKM